MFIVDTLLLVVAVYLAPAIAVRPQLALASKTSVAIPFLSALMVLIAVIILSAASLFETYIVRSLSLVVTVVAALRLTFVLKNSDTKCDWPHFHVYVLLLNIGVAILLAAKLATRGFDADDEIYSWNMWAVQHYLGHTVDLYYTKAPYPQFFPRLLAYCYKLLGDVQFQIAVKTALVVFPLMLLNALGFIAKGINARGVWVHLALVLFVVEEVGLRKIFKNGMPDALTAAALVASAFLLICWARKVQRTDYLILSSLCAAASLLAKQPGLLWGCVSFPLLVLVVVIQNKLSYRSLIAAIFPALIGIIWFVTEGQNFHENVGVVSRSLGDRDYISQLNQALRTYFIEEPAILFLTVASVLCVIVSKRGWGILLLFVLPSLLLWLIFASYDLRAGAPALAMLALLLAYGIYAAPVFTENTCDDSKHNYSKKILFTLSIAIVACIIDGSRRVYNNMQENPGFDFDSGGKNSIIKYFESDAEYVYEELYDNSDITLWIPSNYVYGIFYGHTPVIRPSYDGGYNTMKLMAEISKYKPDYLVDPGDVAYGPGAIAFRKQRQLCPQLFTRIAGPSGQYNYSIYQLEKKVLASESCTQ